MKAKLDAKLYKGMLAERRHAKLKAVTAAAKRANMASRPKDVKELELRLSLCQISELSVGVEGRGV